MAEVIGKENRGDTKREKVPITKAQLYIRPSIMKDGCCLVDTFWEMADQVKELDIKPDDVWVITFPKSGTTWMQETAWLLTHNLDYEGAKTLLRYRSATLESSWASILLGRPNPPLSEFEKIAAHSGGRRVIKAHLHWKLLPKKLHDPKVPAKIIYVSRNPKDVCVSYYYFHRFLEEFRKEGYTVADFADLFMSNISIGPYWTHVKGYWAQRSNPNILFVKYEDMKKDLSKVIQKVALFLEVPIPTAEQMDKLLDHLSFDSVRKNPALNRETGSEKFRDEGSANGYFIRKGIVGDWKQTLTPETVEKMNKWIEENTRDMDYTIEDSL